MVIDGFITMLMFSIRVNATKYCTRILSPLSFVKLNFVGDSLCAIFVILISALSIIDVPLSDYFTNKESLVKGLPVGACTVAIEISCIHALDQGPAGPVTAVISTNIVLISILQWLITGIALSLLQIIGIFIALVGVLTVSLSKQPS